MIERDVIMEIWTNIVLPIISGLVAAIPLVIKLVEVSQRVIKEKNWTAVMQLVLKLMAEAEENYETGAEKKEYVLDSIKALQETLNYDVDLNAIGAMVDSIAKTSKHINIKK
jgi:hypothetical protein